jgi:hypothetical protein
MTRDNVVAAPRPRRTLVSLQLHSPASENPTGRRSRYVGTQTKGERVPRFVIERQIVGTGRLLRQPLKNVMQPASLADRR